MGKAFDFWNGLLTRELGSRLPVDVWEAVLNPPRQWMRPSTACGQTTSGLRVFRDHMSEEQLLALEERLAARRQRLQEEAKATQAEPEQEAQEAHKAQEDDDAVPGETRRTGGAQGSGGHGAATFPSYR